MTAYLYPQENALDFGFEVFAEGRRGETEQAKPENEKEECAAGGGGHCSLGVAWETFRFLSYKDTVPAQNLPIAYLLSRLPFSLFS